MINTVLHRLFVSQWTGYSFLLGIITGCVAYFVNIPYLYPLAFVLITNTYDLLGYGNIMDVVNAYDHTVYHAVLPYYRIMQKIFNYVLMTGIVWQVTGSWLITLGCGLANIGGFQDVLYYAFGRYNFNQNYTWLKWTPLGMLIGDLNKWEFVIQGLVSFTLITIGIWRLC